MMDAQEVLSTINLLAQAGIKVWLDGGWGIDALVNRQTRKHGDLDIVIEKRNLKVALEVLEQAGFAEHPTEDTRPENFVLKHPNHSKIDFHVVEFDAVGNGIYGPKQNALSYPADAFETIGQILGQNVFCLTPTFQLASHQCYPLREKDVADIKNLCETFKLPLPDYICERIS